MSLFHYTSLETFINHILPSGTLMSNNLANLNDPRESERWAFGSINLPLDRLFPDIYSDKTHIECTYKLGQIIKDQFQVMCFSGAVHKGWDNEMMWAHYADRQRGVCLEFDQTKLLFGFKKHFPNVKFEINAVNYEHKRKRRPWINWDYNQSYEENLNIFLEVLSKQVIFYKSHFWEKEDEIRLSILNHSERLYLPFEDALIAVHIGLGIPKSMHDDIFKMVNRNNIRLYVIIYQHSRYERWILTKKEGRWWTMREDNP